jgi:DnaJ-class molecular chaperone
MEAVKGTQKKVDLGGRIQTIKIPAGVDDGSRIRFGDYDVVLDVSQDKRFKRQGFDIVTEQQLSFPQAAIGTEINVETIDGKVKLKIPSGTQPETVIRLRGKGISHLRGSGKGDHYVRIKITVPRNLTARQKELLKEFDLQKKHNWF